MKKIFFLVVLSLSSLAAQASPDDQFNFRFSPALVILGGLGAGLDYRINDQFVAGVQGAAMHFSLFDTDVTGSNAAFHVDYSFRPAFTHGWFLTGQAGYTSADVSYKDSDGQKYSASGRGGYVAVGGGYHWFWSSFNMSVAGLLGSNPIGEIEVKNNNGEVIKTQSSPLAGLMGEFQLGFTF